MDEEEVSLNPEDYLTVKECADACRFKGPEAIRRAIKRGELRAYNMKYHHMLVLKSDFIRWFRSRMVKPEPALKKEPKVPFRKAKTEAAK